jgi:uncharacterized protein (DUF302 family)
MGEEPATASPEGLIRRPSAHGFQTPLERLEPALPAHGLAIFAQVDHGAAAQAAGLHLPASVVFVVGTARTGTPLVAERPWLAIDLPLRILVRELEPGGATEVGFNDPAWVAARHGADRDAPQMADMRASLSTILTVATENRS